MEAAGMKRSTEICKDFNRGLCNRGDACRYLHVTIPAINKQTEELAKKPKVDGDEDEIQRLRAENQALRISNKKLTEEVAQLRTQLGLPPVEPDTEYGYVENAEAAPMEAQIVEP